MAKRKSLRWIYQHELKKSQTASADTAFKGNLAEAKKCLEPNQMLERMSTHGR